MIGIFSKFRLIKTVAMRLSFHLFATVILFSACATTNNFELCRDVNCQDCRGTGNRGFCNGCDGKGTVSCSSCETGFEMCPSCYGEGIRRCGKWVLN
jgi:hypothetical protein